MNFWTKLIWKYRNVLSNNYWFNHKLCICLCVVKAAIKLVIHRNFLFLKHLLLFPGIEKENRKKLAQYTRFNWSFVPSHISVTDDLTIWGICLLWVIKRKVCQVTRTWLTYQIVIVTFYSLCNFWNNTPLICYPLLCILFS